MIDIEQVNHNIFPALNDSFTEGIKRISCIQYFRAYFRINPRTEE